MTKAQPRVTNTAADMVTTKTGKPVKSPRVYGYVSRLLRSAEAAGWN